MPDPEATLFAHLDQVAGVVTARLVGPSFGEREGTVVFSMIDGHLGSARPAARAVVLDFGEIDFVNSAGLGALVRIRNSCATHRASIVLYGLTDSLLDVFRMSRLDKLFTIATNERKLAKALKTG